MVTMKKANRVITVDASRAESYLSRGYDQVDSKGKVIKEATAGKAISVAEYNALKERAEKFAERGKQLEDENKSLKAEIEALRGKGKQNQKQKK